MFFRKQSEDNINDSDNIDNNNSFDNNDVLQKIREKITDGYNSDTTSKQSSNSDEDFLRKVFSSDLDNPQSKMGNFSNKENNDNNITYAGDTDKMLDDINEAISDINNGGQDDFFNIQEDDNAIEDSKEEGEYDQSDFLKKDIENNQEQNDVDGNFLENIDIKNATNDVSSKNTEYNKRQINDKSYDNKTENIESAENNNDISSSDDNSDDGDSSIIYGDLDEYLDDDDDSIDDEEEMTETDFEESSYTNSSDDNNENKSSTTEAYNAGIGTNKNIGSDVKDKTASFVSENIDSNVISDVDSYKKDFNRTNYSDNIAQRQVLQQYKNDQDEIIENRNDFVGSNGSYISDKTKNSVQGSITQLIESVKNQVLAKKQLVSETEKSKTLEQFLAEIIQPKIVEYLDANLDRIVKKIVKDEIDKIVDDID